MKKFISAVLSLVLAISMMSTAVMAEEEAATVTSTEVTEEVTEINSAEAVVEETEEEVAEEEEETENQAENARIYEQMLEEIALVSALGVNVDTNRLNQNIERHEFASMLLALLDKDGVGGANVTFHDVTPENSYYDDVMSAALFGVLHGDGVGYVNPERYLDFDEAVKMAVVALDMQYQNYADALGGYPDGYRVLAESLGLTKKISQRAGDVSYATAIKILYNMMYSNYYKVAIVQNHCVLQETDETNLEHYYNLTKYDGIVTNTPYTLSILGNDKTNVIEIDGEVYTMELGTEFDANAALGKSVLYYLDEEEVVRVIVPKANKNYVLEVQARDIVQGDLDGEMPTSLRYYPNGQDKAKTVSFGGATFFYNGSLSTELVPADLYPTDGKITFVDNDGDSSYDYVIIESYVQRVAQSSSFGQIAYKYVYDDNDDAMIMADEDSNIKLYRDGVEITASFIGEWDSLKIMMPKSGNGGIINVSGKEVTGTVEKFKSDDYDNRIAVVSGKEYRISKVYQDAVDQGLPSAKTFDVGYNVTLALDDENAIIGVKDVKNGAGEYGYLVKIYGGDTTKAKIFTVSGTMVKLDLADRVTIGDEKYNVADGSIEALEGILIDAGTGETYDQLIKYKVNSKGLINEIMIAEDRLADGYVNDGTFALCYQEMPGYGSFHSSTETKTIGINYDYRVSTNQKTPIFFVPNYEGASDEEYYVYDAFVDWWTYRKDVDIKIYDAQLMNPNYYLKNAGAMVGYVRQSDTPAYPWGMYTFGTMYKYIVLDVNTAINEDDEEIYIVDLVQDNWAMRSESVVFSDDAFNVDTGNLFGGGTKTVADLREGDLISIKYDNDKKVDRKVVSFLVFGNSEWYGDPEKERMYTTNPDDPDSEGDRLYLMTYGTVIYSSGEEFIVKTKTRDGKDYYVTFISGTTSGNVYVYDTYSEEISLGTKAHLVAGARVVCSGSWWDNFGTVIVVND